MIDTSAFEDCDETMEGTEADDADVQERILNQMLARRRRDESEGRLGLYGEGEDEASSGPFLAELMQEASKRRKIGDLRGGQAITRSG